MINLTVEWGIGHDNLPLVVITPEGLVSAPYPASFRYENGEISWWDRLGADPSFGISHEARDSLAKGRSRIVILFGSMEVEIDLLDGVIQKVDCLKGAPRT